MTASLRGRPGSAPARLRLLRAAAFTACAALAVALLAGGVWAETSWSAIRTHSAPQVTSAAGLYFALNDMDAPARALARAVDAYRADPADLRFTGFLGDGFRNITFPGERTAAERALARYQVYERDDRKIRALAEAGGLPAAVAYCTGYAPGESNHDFAAFDGALGKVVAINLAAYEKAASDGADRALPLPLGLAGALVAAAGLVVLGLRPRLAEFR
ncbi:hypothetical protein ACFZAU_17710 [Streptomyces sp. NPDC008238]